MPTSASTHPNVADRCPFCHQRLAGEDAGQFAAQSMTILEQRLPGAGAKELVAELEAAHRMGWARVESSPEAEQKELAADKAHFAEDTDRLRQGVRQF